MPTYNLRRNSRTHKVANESATAITTVQTGEKPQYKNKYEQGRFNNNKVPAIIW